MPLSFSSARGGNGHRGRRWSTALVAVGLLLAACAVGVGVRGLVESGRPADAQQPAATGIAPMQGTTVAHDRHVPGCPKGAVPRMEIDDMQVHPSLQGGIWLHPGRYRITVRGDLINDASAAIAVRGVPLTIGSSRWRAHARYARAIGPYSSKGVAARGTLVVTGRERMVVAGRLSWVWGDPDVRHCGSRGLAEDD